MSSEMSPTTPTSSGPDSPLNPTTGSSFLDLGNADKQLAFVFSFLNLDDPVAKQAKERLNELVDIDKQQTKVVTMTSKYVTMTSGKYVGEKRYIYLDEYGKAFYLEGKKTPKRLYLEDYVDKYGVPRSLTASNTCLIQYKALMEGATPTTLFPEDEVEAVSVVEAAPVDQQQADEKVGPA